MCEDNCLQTVNPDLAKQWHHTKNAKLSPRDVTACSQKKVWWQCSNGHEWPAIVGSRNNGCGCPYCSNKAVCEDNCLQKANPTLTKEWHPTKNGELTPRDVTAYAHKKVWWQCSDGHEWQAKVTNRSSGTGCPYCSNKAVCEDNCLQTLNSTLTNEWHPTKNGKLSPRDVTAYSGKKVWWQCSKEHEWQAKVSDRNNRGCPYCSGRRASLENCLQKANPDLAKEWHPTKNGNLTPRDVTAGSHKKVWWQCSKEHEWQAEVGNRSNGNGCPYCSGRRASVENCLQKANPTLAKEWHPTKNSELTPRDVTACSGKKVWWLCSKGHEWESTISSRNKGRGCSYCVCSGLVNRKTYP